MLCPLAILLEITANLYTQDVEIANTNKGQMPQATYAVHTGNGAGGASHTAKAGFAYIRKGISVEKRTPSKQGGAAEAVGVRSRQTTVQHKRNEPNRAFIQTRAFGKYRLNGNPEATHISEAYYLLLKLMAFSITDGRT